MNREFPRLSAAVCDFRLVLKELRRRKSDSPFRKFRRESFDVGYARHTESYANGTRRPSRIRAVYVKDRYGTDWLLNLKFA